jgi:23S rRNA (adenine2503-C2)-methyltransferase
MQSNIQSKSFLLDYTREELRAFVQKNNLESYRADQIFRGIYVHSLSDFDQLTTISKSIRARLSQLAVLRTLTQIKTTRSPIDNTTKFLWKLSDTRLVVLWIVNFVPQVRWDS